MRERECVKRGHVEVCMEILMRCCNDYAYVLHIEKGGVVYKCYGVYNDDLSRDFYVCNDYLPVSHEELEDILLELDARLSTEP